VALSQLHKGRLLIVFAGALWSLSGLFAKALTVPNALGLNEPRVSFLAIAHYRAVFAFLAIVPFLRSDTRPSWSGNILGMVVCFVTMCVLFVSAMTAGSAASAILLQYTAPLWVLLFGVMVWKEPCQAQDVKMVIGGLLGISILIIGNWRSAQASTVVTALGSGFFYAGVVLFLRSLRHESAPWLTAINMFGTAIVLSPVLFLQPLPRPAQLAWLAAFGIVQLAIPYWLMARGLRHVSSVEAGLLTLIEPVLNPFWAFLIAPTTERPSLAEFVGGTFIVGALAMRYWPARPKRDQ
jgi:drug/metabolite transporter (DMT)-like permease